MYLAQVLKDTVTSSVVAHMSPGGSLFPSPSVPAPPEFTHALRPLAASSESRPKEHSHSLSDRVGPEALTLPPSSSRLSLRASASLLSLSSNHQPDIQRYIRAVPVVQKKIDRTTDAAVLQQFIDLRASLLARIEALSGETATLTTMAKARRDTEVFDTFDFPTLSGACPLYVAVWLSGFVDQVFCA